MTIILLIVLGIVLLVSGCAARGWIRVSRARPCPICHHIDWCAVAADGSAALCHRVESARLIGEAGWWHRLDGGEARPFGARTVAVPDQRPGRADLHILAANYSSAVNPARLERLAGELGVSVASLRRLGIGWAHDHGGWAFPMTDHAGRVLGIRLRLPDGRKLAVRGGREGLFIADAVERRRNRNPAGEGVGEGIADGGGGNGILICEGASDAAALLDLGFDAVGRPSCTGGTRLLLDLMNHRGGEAVIVADGDAPGQRGAADLAGVLVAYSAAVRIIRPPGDIKDARQWVNAGASRADVLAAIEAAPIRRLAVKGVPHE